MVDSVGGGEHDEGDVDVAEDGELVGLLDESIPPFRVSHLSVRDVLYPLNLELHPTHFWILLDKQNTTKKETTPTFLQKEMILGLSLTKHPNMVEGSRLIEQWGQWGQSLL